MDDDNMTKSKCRARCFRIFAKKGLLLVLVLLSSLVSLPILCAAASPGDVVINEIAWMGTQASTADEWIELYNNTDAPIDLISWLLSAADGYPSIFLSGTIPANGFFLLERANDDTVSDIQADGVYGTGYYTWALSNNGELLSLKDEVGTMIDEVDCSAAWFSGEASPSYITMERVDPLSSGDAADKWNSNNPSIAQTGLDAAGGLINGTPKARNSATNKAPIANVGEDQTVLIGDTVQLDGSTSWDPDGDPLGYNWTFVTRPSGSSASLFATTIVDPTFGADLPGEYIVKLVVNDNYRGSDSDQVIVTAQVKPVAAFTCDPQSSTVWDTVRFTDLSTDIDGTIASWSWQFGDGAVSVDRSPAHRYWDPGTYAVVLEVTDDDGLSDSVIREITIALGPGDLDDDGMITVLDVRLCLQIATGVITCTPLQQDAADVDSDGDVDMDDAQILAEDIIGIRQALPGGS